MSETPPPAPPKTLKARVKEGLAPLVRAALPTLESLAQAGAPRAGLDVKWTDTWAPAFDAALEQLPALEDCSRDLYRELLRPTSAKKRHALVSENGAPLALISLRQRGHAWEPVTFQCVPFAIAPAHDHAALGRALHALGLNILLAGGLGDYITALNPTSSWAYDWHAIDLSGDYEGYWRQKKRQYTISRARRHLKEFEVRIDGEGDLEWIVNKWREQWADDPGREIVAADDRLNFWPRLMTAREPGALRVRTIMLAAGGERVGGLVFTTKGDTAMAQCGGRDAARDDGYLAAAFTVALVEWAKANGFKAIDMAGGDYKRHWGPVAGQRHGAIFRPRLLQAFAWAL